MLIGRLIAVESAIDHVAVISVDNGPDERSREALGVRPTVVISAAVDVRAAWLLDGARAVLDETEAAAHLADIVHLVSAGWRHCDPAVARHLLDSDSRTRVELSPRERAILCNLSDGRVLLDAAELEGIDAPLANRLFGSAVERLSTLPERRSRVDDHTGRPNHRVGGR